MRLRPAVPVLPSLLVASRLEPLLLAQPADSRPAALLDEIGAATLVLGTALGGGFLALPHATAPAGCLPATAVLTLCWLFLLLESLLVADLVIDATSEASPGGTPSFDSLGRAAFGDAGGAAVSATFLVLMLTTLVAQIAKASELAGGGAFGAAPRSLRCALLTAPLAALTVGFVASAASLFLASWSRLSRADWSVAAAAAPSLLQLHVRVRRALLGGSVALLAMQLAWSSLGIARLSPPPPRRLAGGGALSSASGAVAACAIATTILGTGRALATPAGRATSGLRSLAAYCICCAIPVLIAARASSAAAFFGAIDLAGAYPVALLWGLLPPLMTLRARSRRSVSLEGMRSFPVALLVGLASLSVAFMGGNAAFDFDISFEF
ncbi:hypothetical protein EMIHUDRAFT_237294 [Emiliania huxleyi CCMP1516]|uniref:Amino acid transporter transmembrane domain-containing protein n=2 Tax=Emiliania huxleyi TaxID=2903 RepID=A0A0D3JR76_EMIH1|nr:hypothetical protein EMIHUDRAFT_237294 [Emiliania huxleyi CCMP1516]EOD26011.1 hypothetical protein EMIHUDRAFT_237294 [Emiliania huxleyi CCMP1516]|eukprot:XP_005778440.1 hypothetical protein EMIHUDRAFT_237294 [Emiliania huxleyi CCMP1516]